MNIVLDTNVIVSGLLSESGPPSEILRHVILGDLGVCYDDEIMAEYFDVLRREKFKIPEFVVRNILQAIIENGIEAVSGPTDVSMPDESDRKFYEMAKTYGCILVTGNKRHFPDESTVMSPSEFVLRK